MAGPIIVGTKECSVRDVANKLHGSDSYHLLTTKWSDIAHYLDLPDHQILSWRRQLSLEIVSFNDLLLEIFNHWVEQKGNEARLDELLDALRSSGMRSLAEELQAKIVNQPGSSQRGENEDPPIWLNTVLAIPESSTSSQSPEVIKVGNKISYFPGKFLGGGFMGSEVYKGLYEGRIPVAVKQLKERFHVYVEKEVNLLCQTDKHENVVRYYCSEVQGSFRYIASELCQATLKDWVEKTDKGMEVQNITDLTILEQCVDGLMFIHENNVVHRDLRPSNILLVKLSKYKIVVKISDFGFAKGIKVNHQSYSDSGTSGSLGWIAPEVSITEIGSKIKAASFDTFSLGCIFFNVVTRGGHPFGDKDDVIKRQVNIEKGQFTIPPDLPYHSRGMTNLKKLMIDTTPGKRPPLCIVKSHPVFWNTRKILNFLAQINALQRDRRLFIEDAFSLLEKLGKDALRKDRWIKRASDRFKHDFSKDPANYKESVGDLIRAIRNYGGLGVGHQDGNSTPDVFRLRKSEELLNDWLEMFPKLLPCAWIAFKSLADKDVEGFCDFYEDKGNPFWNTDAFLDLI